MPPADSQQPTASWITFRRTERDATPSLHLRHSVRCAGRMSAEKSGREGRSLSLALRRASQQSASTSGVYRQSKKFPNGDTYSGGWRNGLPEGEGRYCWADGSIYEGGWKVCHSPWLPACPQAIELFLLHASFPRCCAPNSMRCGLLDACCPACLECSHAACFIPRMMHA